MVKMAKSDQQMWSEYKDFRQEPVSAQLHQRHGGPEDEHPQSARPAGHDLLPGAAHVQPLRTSATVGEVGLPLHAVRRERPDRWVLAL